LALYYPEDKVAASRYVKQAIPLMIQNDIPPNPCNYALWYSYVSNRDKELRLALDDVIKEKGTCPPLQSKKLFEEHVVKEEKELQIHMQESLSDVITDLATDAANTAEGTKCYAKNLEQSLDALAQDQAPEEIKKTVEQLIAATHEENSIIETFEQQMKAAELEIQSLREQLAEREKDAATDQLTKLANRRAFDEHLYKLVDAGETASLIIIDLDHFKQLNDTYGHLLGDKVLQGVGALLKKIAPENSLAARYGGEEFAILFDGDQDKSYLLAEEIRVMLQKLSIKKKNSAECIDNITASFGVAQLIDGEYPEQLIERADAALYRAKEEGRNTVRKAA